MAVVIAVAGCGGGGGHASSSTAPPSTPTITIAAGYRGACALLVARLGRVTAALTASSELTARSRNKRELTHRIRVEEVQLERSATLMSGGPIPPPLVPADRRLVASLRAFARDFGRARGPAARGDFAAAAAAMSDEPVVRRIVQTSKTIDAACS